MCKKESKEHCKQVNNLHWQKTESVNTFCAILALVKQDKDVLNRIKKRNYSSGFLQEALAISAANTPLSISTIIFIAAIVFIAATVYTAALLLTTTNDFALPTV